MADSTLVITDRERRMLTLALAVIHTFDHADDSVAQFVGRMAVERWQETKFECAEVHALNDKINPDEAAEDGPPVQFMDIQGFIDKRHLN